MTSIMALFGKILGKKEYKKETQERWHPEKIRDKTINQVKSTVHQILEKYNNNQDITSEDINTIKAVFLSFMDTPLQFYREEIDDVVSSKKYSEEEKKKQLAEILKRFMKEQ